LKRETNIPAPREGHRAKRVKVERNSPQTALLVLVVRDQSRCSSSFWNSRDAQEEGVYEKRERERRCREERRMNDFSSSSLVKNE